MKFIVVDDNKTFREGVKFYLENILQHEVIHMASDGLEFLKIENKRDADIIIMDIEMPNMNGIDAVKIAIWEQSDLNFIAVTNYSDKAYLDELIGAGFKSCIFKSNIYDELEKAINAVKKNQLSFPKKMNIRSGLINLDSNE